jgi:membrane protein YdbS with pleckstrin-like domain
MRFQTKLDLWLVIVLVVAALASLGLPWILPAGGAYRHPAPLWVRYAAWLVWAYVLLATLPQYYEVRPEGLFIRQGVRKALIPYDALLEVQPRTDARSAGVYSLDRVQVVTQGRGTFVIAPREQNRFLEELARRAPQLGRKGFGLGAGRL